MRRAIMLATALGLIAPTVHAIEVEPDAFRPYAAGLIDRLALGTEGLARAIEVGDLGQARKAWIAARVGWERGETFLGEYFPEADETIDSWPDARSGFHALEPLLFKEDDLGAAKPMVERLREDVDALRASFDAQAFDAQGLVNGLAGIAFEIGDAKVDGGESPFAATSLKDMQDNMRGIEALYVLVFAGPLEAQEPALHARIVGRMIELAAALDQPSIAVLDRSQVMVLSEQLAGDFLDAAGVLGLEEPMLGG